MIRQIGTALFALAFISACGGSGKEAEAPEASTEAEESPAATPEEVATDEEQSHEGPANGPWDIPSECHDGDSPCTANPKWVKKLCEDVYPAVALYLFHSSSPFTHGYLSRKTRAVNASGGATSGDEWLAFDEEVVLLHYRKANLGGMQVSGAGGGYEALRMDGSCVTLGSDEVRLQKPPTPKYAKVAWRYMGKDMQSALTKHEGIKAAYIERRKECKGAYSGSVSKKCVTKDDALNKIVIDAVTAGEVEIPQPEFRP